MLHISGLSSDVDGFDSDKEVLSHVNSGHARSVTEHGKKSISLKVSLL